MEHGSQDFAATVAGILSSESLIRIKPAAPVMDVSGLVQIIQTMAQKIEQQETELMRQRDLLDSLVHEVATLRVGSDDHQILRRDMKRVVNEVEAMSVQQRMQNQRLDRLRSDVDDMDLEHRSPGGVATPDSAQVQSPLRTASNTQLSRTPSGRVGTNQQRPVVGLELVDSTQGLRVQSVKPGGPASLAGLVPGDIIVACNSEECTVRQTFLNLLEQSTIGQPQDITFYRDNQRRMTRLYVVSGSVDTPRSPDRR